MNYGLGKIIAVGVIVFLAFVLISVSSYIIEPGMRGIKVTLGKAMTNSCRKASAGRRR